MKYIILLFVFTLLNIQIYNVYSQDEKIEFDTRYYIGGEIGFQIGTIIFLNVSPHIGYYLIPRLSIGSCFTYQYLNNAATMQTLNIFGGSIFLRYDILDRLYLHAENEVLNYKTDMFSNTGKVEHIVSNNILIGGGYRQFFSGTGKNCFYVMILYNLNETIYTPYGNPVIRAGIEFHF